MCVWEWEQMEERREEKSFSPLQSLHTFHLQERHFAGNLSAAFIQAPTAFAPFPPQPSNLARMHYM